MYKKELKLSYFLPVYLFIFIMSYIFGYIFSNIFGIPENFRILFCQYIIYISFSGFLFIIFNKYKLPEDRKMKEKINPGNIAELILITLSILILSMFMGLRINPGFIDIFGIPLTPNFFDVVFESRYKYEFLTSKFLIYALLSDFLYIIVIPAVTEIINRKIILSGLSRRISYTSSIIITSIFFSGGYSLSLHSFLFGFLMSLLYLKNKNIKYNILINVLYSALLILSSDFLIYNGSILNSYLMKISFITSAILAFAYIARYCYKNFPSDNYKNI